MALSKFLIQLCLIFIITLFPMLAISQNVHISGTVTGFPNLNLLEGVKVVAVVADSGSRIDSAYTNTGGFYDMNISWTGISENEQIEDRLYPTIYSATTTVFFYAPQAGQYTLSCFNANGPLILAMELDLEKGGNEIILTGGNAGLHLFRIEGAATSKTFKAIQTTSTGAQIHSTLSGTGGPMLVLKSGLNEFITVGDEVRLEFTYSNTNPKDSYNSKDTTFIVAPNQTIDQQMQQQEYIFTTTLKPYLDDGTPVTSISPGWTTTFEFPSPVGTKTYTPNGNNEIIIQEGFYPLNGELGNVTMHHDTSNYTVNSTVNGVLSWIVLRTQNQPTEVRNKAQTSSFDLIPEATTTTTLDSLDGLTLNYYTLPKNAETQPGTRFNLLDARGWMMSSGDGLETSKFIQVPPYGHVVLMKTVYDNDNTKFPTQANMDRAINEYNKAIDLTIMANNDNITQPTQFFYTNMNDSIWNAVQSRNPLMDNTLTLAFYQGSPSVSRTWVNTYTYDNESRLKATKSKYPESATDGQIFTENYSATYGITEGSGGLAPYVYIGTTGQPTDLAGRMGRWVKILDLGSGNQ